MVIYISGYGRSGSTVLDAILGNHDQIFGCGELMWLFHRLSSGERCSCGKCLEDCEIWGKVANVIRHSCELMSWTQAAKISYKADVNPFRKGPCPEYKMLWRTAIHAIQAATNKSTIVDSSKSNHIGWKRISNLQSALDQDIKVIHLVRDPRAVMWSVSRGRNKSLAKGEAYPSLIRGAGAVLSWSLSNSLSEYAVRKGCCESLLLRYEDLVRNPVEAFKRLGIFLGMDLGELSQRLLQSSAMRAGHGVDGNRMRNRDTFILRNDESWQEAMTFRANRCAEIFAAGKLDRYGYSRIPE